MRPRQATVSNRLTVLGRPLGGSATGLSVIGDSQGQDGDKVSCHIHGRVLTYVCIRQIKRMLFRSPGEGKNFHLGPTILRDLAQTGMLNQKI